VDLIHVRTRADLQVRVVKNHEDDVLQCRAAQWQDRKDRDLDGALESGEAGARASGTGQRCQTKTLGETSAHDGLVRAGVEQPLLAGAVDRELCHLRADRIRRRAQPHRTLPRDRLRGCLAQDARDARIVGAVLNKVDFTKARLYGLNTFA
jgi:hypothetical protein